jgi:hypothetical protein
MGRSRAHVAAGDPGILDTTAPASGTPEDPGRNVRARSGPDRAVPDQGRGMFPAFPKCRPEAGGGMPIPVPLRRASRRRPVRGRVREGDGGVRVPGPRVRGRRRSRRRDERGGGRAGRRKRPRGTRRPGPALEARTRRGDPGALIRGPVGILSLQ